MASGTSPSFEFPYTMTQILAPLIDKLPDDTLRMLDSMLVERDQAVEDALTYKITAPAAGSGGSSAGASAASSVTSETTYGIAPAVGTSSDYARADHTHGTPASTALTPASTVVSETAFGQASAVGVGTLYARNDHTHGTPTDPIPAHVAAGDPHTQYALDTDVAALMLRERVRRLMLVA